MRQLAFAALLAASLPALTEPAVAQAPADTGRAPPELVDGIVAVVGDSVVLRSEVDEQLLELARSGQPLPEDPSALDGLRRQILQGLVEELVLLHAAARDSIEVPQQQVDELVEQDMARRERAFGGRRQLEQALQQQRLTVAEYRGLLADRFRRREMIQTYLAQQRSRPTPPVTEDEVRAYFEEQRQRFGERPATIGFKQVVVTPEPADSARAAARAEIEDIQRQLREGEEFETLARRHSDDASNREQGGDLGWFRQGRMVEAFDRTVFALRPGQVSGIVETPFGFHLIKLERVRGAERQARHILVQPAMTDEDIGRAELTAQLVVEELRDGTPVDSLIEAYGDPTEQAEVSGFRRDQLPPPYDQVLADAGEGDVIGPIRLEAGGAPKFAVVRVEQVAGAGEVSFDDVRVPLRRELQQQKMVEELVAELRRRTYVDIRI